MIDPKKQYRTRDGREVRIYATDGDGEWPVHGAVAMFPGRWVVRAWMDDGSAASHHQINSCDLIEVKPRIKREVWVNVYQGGVGNNCETRELADRMGADERIACVKLVIDCEEGEGL